MFPRQVEKPVLTRKDQLSLRNGRKGKGGSSKATKKKRKSPAKRKRSVLKAARAKKLSAGRKKLEVAEDEAVAFEEAAASKGKKGRGKAKAAAKATAKATAKAKAKAKAKGKAKAGPKAAAKPKAKAKSKAAAKSPAKKHSKDPKPGKGKGKRKSRDESVEAEPALSLEEAQTWYFQVTEASEIKDMIVAFALEHDGPKPTPAFKAAAKGSLAELHACGLTIYWTRPAVGLLNKHTGKDVTAAYMSTKGAPSESSWSAGMLTTLKAAELLAWYIDCLIRDGYVMASGLDDSPEVCQMAQHLRMQVFAALEELAS